MWLLLGIGFLELSEKLGETRFWTELIYIVMFLQSFYFLFSGVILFSMIVMRELSCLNAVSYVRPSVTFASQWVSANILHAFSTATQILTAEYVWQEITSKKGICLAFVVLSSPCYNPLVLIHVLIAP